MKTLVLYDKERVNAWVADRIGRRSPWKADYQAFGIERDGKLVGGVVIDGMTTGARCSIHCAGEGKRWLCREFLHVVFDYVFRQCACKVAINPVDSGNAASLRFTAHIGFTEVLRVPEGSGDQDLVIFTMPKAACRWLKE